ncbi:MAG TPA: NAD kinase [Rhodobacteraceae bacterium]|nr:NAD kinase [Paracoccaceae bacterium]
MAFEKIHFTANDTEKAQDAKARLVGLYGQVSQREADVIVPLGGDGFMLSTLHASQSLPAPVYGMHQGTVGFLMNDYNEQDLPARIQSAERAEIHPLKMNTLCVDGSKAQALAINEVSLLRMGPQAAKLQISINGRVRMKSLVCDGALVSTPAGSTAYNYSAHGPILPIDANILALTAVAAFRPRRWRGALLPMDATISFEVLEPKKRPVAAVADSSDVKNVLRVDISIESSISHALLFDPGHGLEERLLNEQFQ